VSRPIYTQALDFNTANDSQPIKHACSYREVNTANDWPWSCRAVAMLAMQMQQMQQRLALARTVHDSSGFLVSHVAAEAAKNRVRARSPKKAVFGSSGQAWGGRLVVAVECVVQPCASECS
jgi:hypothetical protein